MAKWQNGEKVVTRDLSSLMNRLIWVLILVFTKPLGQVRKGEKSTIIVFWKNSLEKDETTGKTKKMFLLKFYHVFNSEQADFDEQGTKKIAELQNLVTEKVNYEHLE